MFAGLKRRIGGKKPVVSYNRADAYRECVMRVMRIHHRVIVSAGEERERGLEDALISPMAIEGFCDRLEYCPDCFSKAAMAIDYIANFHPFVEGNKRTAFQLAVAILRVGGYEPDDDEATFRFVKDAAWGRIDREEIEDWLRRNTHVSSP